MESIEILKELIGAIESKKWRRVSQLLYDGFSYSGAMPEHVGKEMFITYHKRLLFGFPDWQYNLSSVRKEGNLIKGTLRATATHNKELKLSALGLSDIPATGKKIKMPPEEIEVIVEDNLIIDITTKPPIRLNINGIMEQLKVQNQ